MTSYRALPPRLVGAQRDPVSAGTGRHQGERGLAFGCAGSLGQPGVDDQSVPVLHAAFLAMKVAFPVAARRRRLAAAVLRDGSSSCWPRLQSACRRPRNARPTAAS